MTNYEHISSRKGVTHWISSYLHDNGQTASDGGGKSTLSLSSPGKGKSTLMCTNAELCMYIDASKGELVRALVGKDDLSSFNVFSETVIWRVRDFDSFSNIIKDNWELSLKVWRGCEINRAKDFYLFVHEDDDVVFYSYTTKNKAVPVQNLPPIQRYKDVTDLMRKMHWGAINAVLEPQTYTLSQSLIMKLRQKKMDINEKDDREQNKKENDKERKNDKKPGRPRSAATTETKYERMEVSPAYFWFDLISGAQSLNKMRHITFCIDEWDDIAEARSEGDVWKLIDNLAANWKDLRKNNISTHLSTHQTDYVDWRILKRIDYFIWMKGAQVHPSYSMIKQQSLISDLDMGWFIMEQRMVSFGKVRFEKIPRSHPSVRIEGLKGNDVRLSPKEYSYIVGEMAEV